MDYKKGNSIDPGVVARLTGQSYAPGANAASNWFAPLQPLAPVAPTGSPARAFDYLTGYNILINPRADEVVTYDHMRYVAENCGLVTWAIETRKDQIARQKWVIRKAEEGPMTAQQRKQAAADPRIREVTDFFRSPDREYTWDGWLRKLVHEVLVTDAPAVYLRRTVLGKPYAALTLDGTTITRKINLDGTTPLPPETAYQQIIKGVPYADYTTDELVFRPRNPRAHKLYGFSPVEQVIFTANMIMRRDMFKLNTYTEGNLPPALVSVEDDWTADQIEDFQRKFDAINQGDLAQMRRLQFIPKVNSITMLKQDVLKDEADEWFARLIMYAFSLPPTALTKQVNRATAEQQQESADNEGLEPLKLWTADFINTIIRKLFGYLDIEFAWQQEKAIDPKEQAEIHAIYVDKGIMSRNLVLEQLGLDPIEGGDIVTITTPGGLVLLSDAVMSTEEKVDAGLIPDPSQPKPDPFAPTPENQPSAQPEDKPEEAPEDAKAVKNALAQQLMDTYEDLAPELRDPVIVAKLVELERG